MQGTTEHSMIAVIIRQPHAAAGTLLLLGLLLAAGCAADRTAEAHAVAAPTDRTRRFRLLPLRDLARQSRRHAAHPCRRGPGPRPARRHSRSPLRRQAYG